ncbi:MAG: FAD/NAD(P)-binding oxidoreductase [Mesorhizobium sp.]|nr:MAG: FAD/NAD(P)-binding oxidoreductase [Mesorhizobium sp.]RWH02847.1 MAG: FAD/NAD(P)-binding oxidoreductase [Mesorhizobium sp.]TIN47489.1 MAG: NAD(P)/FAD-dependent oxidoreductase [Mesorhizobium sp.]TIR95558.1 MAG: NAD(P)/FAD-dependent oxidoreductase [Mesorhizobium sp.]TIS03132.1 MAG: NAD(P)/FAD-dependent oxidoreductase [Mesorhizobium sp.]
MPTPDRNAPDKSVSATAGRRFDVAVIGGGVVGLAILRHFSMAGLRCVLLERGADILSGASKGNSALLHTGFDAPPDSLELACIKAGYAEYLDIHEKLNLPITRSSALVVGWSDEECSKLNGIVGKAHENGIGDVRLVGRTELAKLEPSLSTAALGAVLVPGEHIIDPWSAPLAYARQAIAHGAVVLRATEVTGGERIPDGWSLKCALGTVQARIVINAAGNFGDLIEKIARPPPFRITPRKGQFVVFDKPASKLVNAIILPVPTERTKGVVLFRTCFGNLAIGPTAEDVEEREIATTDTATLERLRTRAIEMVPDLANVGVNATYAGLRPASRFKDYVIEALTDSNWITVAGIRSTGLTASLGIARHVGRLYAERFGELPNAGEPVWTPVANLTEGRHRPYMDGGEIVCHCEWVTRAEIEGALEGPLPAKDLGGLKRRTRAMMGRCQGFNCSAHVEAILREKLRGTA